MNTPGNVLDNYLKNSGMSRKELSQRLNVSEKHICTIINGEKSISPAFARKLGYVFEDTAFWLNEQAKYDDEQSKIKEINSITAEEIGILKVLHEVITYCIEKEYLHNNCGDAEKVMQLRDFLKISSLTLIPNITYNAAYRAQVSTNIKVDPYVLFAWQRICEKETNDIEIAKKLDKKLLKAHINEIKALMFEDNVEKAMISLQEMLADCGIAFQVVRNFRGAPVQGFIKETTDNRLILCLTIRQKRADIFWFTLFHEIAHILNCDYSSRFVDFDSASDSKEIKADEFAGNTLIPPKEYKEFLHSEKCTSIKEIRDFAKKICVEPFIVIGRLQKDGIIDWTEYNNEIPRYVWE